MHARVFTVVGLIVLVFSGTVILAQSDDAEAPPMSSSGATYARLEQEINALKHANQELEAREKQIERDNLLITKRIEERRQGILYLEIAQTFLNPTRFFSPALSNLGFFFGAAALLLLVIGWPSSARKLLSLRYPFGLPASTTDKGDATPISAAARIVWILLAILLLILLALPAMAQDDVSESVEIVEEADAPQVSSTRAVEPVSTIQLEIHQALDYINFAPLDRALHILDNLQDGETVSLTLEPELLRLLSESADRNKHLPLVAMPERADASVTEEVRKNSLGYYFIKASLYEAASRSGVRELLDKGVAPLLENKGASLGQLNMQALMAIMMFLAAYESADNVEAMIPHAMEKASQLGEVIVILEIAHELDLAGTYQEIIEKSFGRQQRYNVVERIFDLAMKHNRRQAAEIIIASAIKQPYSELSDNLNVVRLMKKIAEEEQVVEQLNALAANKRVSQLLEIARTAHALNLAAQCETLMLKAVSGASDRDDFEGIIEAADTLKLLSVTVPVIADVLKAAPVRLRYQLPPAWPGGFEAPLYEEEGVSLGAWVAAYLHAQRLTPETSRELFETTLRRQLNEIIDSFGMKPLLTLNDLHGLVHYYAETNTKGMDSAMKMLALQRFLRGLSDEEEMVHEDARLLALQMELDQLKTRNKRLEDSVASLEDRQLSLKEHEAEVNIRLQILGAEVTAKGLLLILALWIAFSRALAAAKTAPNFRFSNFCLTFTETIGFECCCTVIFIVPGAVITLVSQDRLKHLRIMEYAPLPQPPAPCALPDLPEAPETPTGRQDAAVPAPEETSP